MNNKKYLAILLVITMFINITSVNIYSYNIFNNTENTILQDDVTTSAGINVSTESSKENDLIEFDKEEIVNNDKLYLNDTMNNTSVSDKKTDILEKNEATATNIYQENDLYTSSGAVEMTTKKIDSVVTNSALEVENIEDLEFTKSFKLEEDLKCKNLNVINGILDLNGHTLIVFGQFNQSGGTVNINGGNLIVNGNYSLSKSDSK